MLQFFNMSINVFNWLFSIEMFTSVMVALMFLTAVYYIISLIVRL